MNIEKKLIIKKLFSIAIENHHKNKFNSAENLYFKILKHDSNHIGANNNLGILFHQKKNYKKAISYFERVIKIDYNNCSAFNNLGLIYHQLKNYKKAINFFKKIIQINFNYLDAHFNLGNSYKQLGENKKAIDSYNKAIEINPNYSEAYINLGNTYLQIGEFGKAISYYERTLQINSTNINAFISLGNANRAQKKFKEAISFYEKALRIKPDNSDTLNNIGSVYKDLKQYNKAKEFFLKAIKFNPNNSTVFKNLGIVYQEIGDHKKACSCYEDAIKIDPYNLASHWYLLNTFPIVYKNEEEINHYRKKFELGIYKINQLLDRKNYYSKINFIDALNSSTNFYLHYQGKNDFNLQKLYASLIEKITKKIYKIDAVPKKHKLKKIIKVGFVSSFFRNHTVSKLFKNWIIKLDKKFFNCKVYYVGDKFDHVTEEIKKNADFFYFNTDVNSLIGQIARDELDILIYLDIGMSSKIQILTSLKLASIQCNTWGHPVSSGFKNIDYFFSSEMMETKDSQKYYSEKLINLPKLGIEYDIPKYSILKKPTILKKDNKTIFFNLQSLFKLLPQDDHIYLDIVKENSNCCFWFINRMNDEVTSIFKERISRLFKNEGYVFEKYFHFHPKCNQDEFLELINRSDIILDSLHWSGGNTSLEAISLNKPIVTYPSNFMRGRHTYAIMKILNIEELIVKSKQEYVKISNELAHNKNFRNSIINKIKKNKNKLFNDNQSTRFLENFIREKVNEMRNISEIN
ncbi:O-linked N-acetylglucosamine transferase, SPINDLY family protein [Candidatus Pelagibacter sp. HIMB1746]|uniref:O-linked N-acetylglucosamine transferase, SPINDLY family protein n=1 Tax=Candidatus Pelagibacter sp. HIMB1746 TaxID=3413370 RepID=UPI003F8331E4